MKILHDGKKVPDSAPTKVVNGQRHLLSVSEIQEREDKRLEWEAGQAAREREEIIRARANEYPSIGDQLDVIWKQLNQFRISGTPLIQEADDMLGNILATKRDNPLPEDK